MGTSGFGAVGLRVWSFPALSVLGEVSGTGFMLQLLGFRILLERVWGFGVCDFLERVPDIFVRVCNCFRGVREVSFRFSAVRALI